jgi:hypothetical protein
LPSAELDQHGLADLEIGDRVRHAIGVRPVATAPGGVDRDLDRASVRRLDLAVRVRFGLEPEGHGEREYTSTRRCG